MDYPVTGLHHITVCAGRRLIKQTILFDDRYAHYHLYYPTERPSREPS